MWVWTRGTQRTQHQKRKQGNSPRTHTKDNGHDTSSKPTEPAHTTRDSKEKQRTEGKKKEKHAQTKEEKAHGGREQFSCVPPVAVQASPRTKSRLPHLLGAHSLLVRSSVPPSPTAETSTTSFHNSPLRTATVRAAISQRVRIPLNLRRHFAQTTSCPLAPHLHTPHSTLHAPRAARPKHRITRPPDAESARTL